jgi:hypothetical protein
LITFLVDPDATKTQITVNEPEKLRDKLPHMPEIAGDNMSWLAAERGVAW